MQANLLKLADKTYRVTMLYAADAYKDVVVGACVTLHGEETPPLSGSTLNALAMQLYKAMGTQ
jgi:hypothetical protein